MEKEGREVKKGYTEQLKTEKFTTFKDDLCAMLLNLLSECHLVKAKMVTKQRK